MLAGSLLLLTEQPQPQPRPQISPTIADRGGGGPSPYGDDYGVDDYVAAFSGFVDIAGEHPVTRALRFQAHMGKALPLAKLAREDVERLRHAKDANPGGDRDTRYTARTATGDTINIFAPTYNIFAPTLVSAPARTREASGTGIVALLIGTGIAIAAVKILKHWRR